MKKDIRENIKRIIKAKEQKKLTIFVGAGVSMNSGVPSWGELIKILKNGIELDDDENDYLKIPQLYYNQRGEKEYYDTVLEALKHKNSSYNPVNEIICSLNPQHIITTNYDVFFEEVVKNEGYQYSIIKSDSDFPTAVYPNYIIKMHGCFEARNIVLKENDYLEYSQNFPLTESYVKGLFASNLVLFIGFSFSDINLKYILQRVSSILGTSKQPSYIYFNRKSSETEKAYLKSKGINPIFYDDVSEYIQKNNINQHSNLTSEGNKLYSFLSLIDKSQFEKDELQKLPIIEQMDKAIEPFKDFGFIMPSVYPKIFPFNKKDENVKLSRSFGYATDDPSCLRIQNSDIINLIKSVLNYNEGEYNKILSLESLEPQDIQIDKYINQKTEGAISDSKQYKMFIEIFKTFNRSRISCINGLSVWVHDKESKECNCISCRYNRCEFDKIVEILNKVSFDSLDYTHSLNDEVIARLMKGFYASKLGLIKVAYEEFQKVRNLAKTNKREVLYFIACYNLKNLPYGFDYENWDFYKKEADKIDLKTTLNSLNVIEEVRNELESLINDKYIYSYTDIIRQLNDKITKTFKLYLNGGHQSGGNVYRDVATNFLVIYEFYHRNRLIDTEYRLFSEFVEICMEGLITNASTPEAKTKSFLDGYERIKEFDFFFIRAMLLYCNTDRLTQILDKLGDNKLQINSSGAIKFLENFKNFLNSFYTTPFGDITPNKKVTSLTHNPISNSFYGKCQRIFFNSLVLLNKIDIDEERKKDIIVPLLNFLQIQNLGVLHEAKNWLDFVKNNIFLFSAEQQKQFVSLILNNTWYGSPIIYHIAKQLPQEVIVLDKLPNVSKDHNHDFILSLGYLYKNSSKEIQPDISKKINDYFSEDKDVDELGFYNLYEYDCFDKEQFSDLIIQKHSSEFTGEFNTTDYSLSNFLYFIGENDFDTKRTELIQMGQKCQYINWLFDFDKFEYSNFNISWFEYKPTIAYLDKMKNNEIVKKKLEEYLKGNTSAELNKKLTHTYFNSFVK